eukprot:5118754-Pyramimonas_sp.AAC.1
MEAERERHRLAQVHGPWLRAAETAEAEPRGAWKRPRRSRKRRAESWLAFQFKACIGSQSRNGSEGATQVEHTHQVLNYAIYDDEWRQMAQPFFYQLTMYTAT